MEQAQVTGSGQPDPESRKARREAVCEEQCRDINNAFAQVSHPLIRLRIKCVVDYCATLCAKRVAAESVV